MFESVSKVQNFCDIIKTKECFGPLKSTNNDFLQFVVSLPITGRKLAYEVSRVLFLGSACWKDRSDQVYFHFTSNLYLYLSSNLYSTT